MGTERDKRHTIAIEQKIISLLRSEVASLQNPSNPTEKHEFHHIDELADILVCALGHPCAEPTLDGLGAKVVAAFAVFAEDHLDLSRLPRSLEDIATGFEGFLKKLGAIRYKDDAIRLRGDGVRYLGLLNTSLGGLLEGRVATIDRSAPKLFAPIVTFSFADPNVRAATYARVRDLRNDVHQAPTRSLVDLMGLFRVASAAYLFAVEENISLIRREIDPLFTYMAKIGRQFNKWEHKYVELLGEQRRASHVEDWPDLQAFEWRDDLDDDQTAGEPWEQLESNPNLIIDDPDDSSRKSVMELADSHKRIWLIGEPGAGKSTSLQALACRRANQLLNHGYLTQPCPVYITANQYDRGCPFRNLIADSLKSSPEQVDVWLAGDRLMLLIDGLNEIAAGEEESAFREISHFLAKYDKLPVILTSRKYGFSERFSLPVFELLPLSDDMVYDYIRRHVTPAEEAEKLFRSLTTANSLLLDFARNPLMLRMLLKIARNGTIEVLPVVKTGFLVL